MTPQIMRRYFDKAVAHTLLLAVWQQQSVAAFDYRLLRERGRATARLHRGLTLEETNFFIP